MSMVEKIGEDLQSFRLADSMARHLVPVSVVEKIGEEWRGCCLAGSSKLMVHHHLQ